MIKNKTTLIVEDNVLISMILERMCTELGLQVIGIARSEQEALDLSVQHQPDLILMDYQLEEGNGRSAARTIQCYLSSPIIFITGSIAPDVQEPLVDDQNMVLPKPFRFEDLKKIVHYAFDTLLSSTAP